MALADLKALISASAQNLSQFKGLSAAYGSLFGGAPSIDGYTFLINSNNNTNFGSGSSVVFNDENIYINTMNALYQGNLQAKAVIDSVTAGAQNQQDVITAVYNFVIPPSLRSQAGLDYFKSQVGFYSARAVELGIPGQSGMAVVALASLIKIAVDNDLGGIGDTINDLRIAVDNGSAQLPQSSFAPTLVERADGTVSDSDDVAIGSFNPGTFFTLTANVDGYSGGMADDVFLAPLTGPASNVVSWSALDTLVGGIGTDRLTVTGLASLTTTPTTLNSIETLQIIKAAETGTLDLSATSGIRSITLDEPVGSYKVQGLGASVSSLSINKPQVGSLHTFTFLNSAVAGSADTVNLNMSGSGGVFFATNVTVGPASGSNGIETIVLNSTLDSVILTLNVDSTQNFYINNDKALPVLIYSASMKNVDGSSSSADQTIYLYGNSAEQTIKTGAGNDAIFGGAGIDVITMGAGKDRVGFGFQSDPLNLIAANRDIVTDFQAGPSGDIVNVSGSLSGAAVTFKTLTLKTGSYAVSSGTNPTGAALHVSAFNLSLTPASADLNLDPTSGGAAALNGTNLLKLLGVGGASATLTAQADGQQGYLVAYSGGNAYTYYFIDRAVGGTEAAGSATLQAEEINLVGVLLNVGTSSLVAANFQ